MITTILLCFFITPYILNFILMRSINQSGFSNSDDGLGCFVVWLFSPITIFVTLLDEDLPPNPILTKAKRVSNDFLAKVFGLKDE